MPKMLRKMRVTRVDLVDNGANQDHTGDGAHVMLYKRANDSEEGDMPKTLNEMSAEELRAHAGELETKVETLEKAAEDGAEALQTLTDKVAELEAAAAVEPEPEPTEEEILKGLPEPVREMLAKREAENAALAERVEKAEKIAKAEREERLTKKYIAKAEELPTLEGETEEIAGDLRAIEENLDEEVAKRVIGQLERANGLLAQSALFEKASRRSGGDQTATEEVEALAKARVEKGLSTTIEQARSDVFAENPALASRVRSES